MTPRLAFLVNGPPESAMGERARAFAARLPGFDCAVLHREGGRLGAAVRFLSALRRLRPQVAYAVDLAAATVAAGLAWRLLSRGRLVVDTGDAIFALARSAGLRGPVGLALTWLLERIGLAAADLVIVRGTRHREVLAARGIAAEVIPDGVDASAFAPRDASALRARLGLEGKLVVGLVGTSAWSPRLGICYGWDLVEAIGLLRDLPVAGLVVGDGTGIPVLRARCRELGVEDRVRFAGRVPYAELPGYLSAMDVCLSTQTDDVVGQVRTTGKLPLYLAAGRYVLASAVGEAALALEPSMLVPYHGTVDREYPRRLAERIRALAASPERLRVADAQRELARRRFDYGELASRLGRLLDRGLAPHR